MSVFVSEYAATHTLTDSVADLVGLPYGRRVRRVEAHSDDLRVALMQETMATLIENGAELDGDTVTIQVNQTRGPSTRVFGTAPLSAVSLRGRSLMLSSACASGVAAAILGARILDSGQVSTVLVVGSSAPSRGDHSSFSGVGALASGPAAPFDSRTTGVRLGAFAGAILLSRQPSRTLKRSLRVAGHGSRLTGAGAASKVGDQVSVMAAATSDAPQGPDVIIAHGTGTVQGDEVELRAIGELAENVWSGPVEVVSQKGGLGHTVHAAGLAAIVSTNEAVQRGYLHGSYGLEDPLEAPPAVRLPRHGKTVNLQPGDSFLVNGFGFGGSNYSLFLQDNIN
ncbi:hypothetical protein ABMA10_18625 [Plantibacter sp. RU18]